MSDATITAERINATLRLIRPYVRTTPIIAVEAADFGLKGAALTLKLELLQHAGSFKARGAFAHLLTRSVPAAGVVAASGGNHGAAVAYAAKRLGVSAKIFVPQISSPAKVARIRSYGADLVVGGAAYAEALAASEAWAQKSGALQVHAFDQDETILGQASVAVELEAQAGDLDTVLVAVGGGGLIAGIAAHYAGRTKVIGVEPELSPTLYRAFEAGRPVEAEVGGIAADALAPRQVGSRVFPIARHYVEKVALVSDEAIRESQKALWETLRIVAEPGGATAFAALLSGRYQPRAGERVGVVVSGGNTTAVKFEG